MEADPPRRHGPPSSPTVFASPASDRLRTFSAWPGARQGSTAVPAICLLARYPTSLAPHASAFVAQGVRKGVCCVAHSSMRIGLLRRTTYQRHADGSGAPCLLPRREPASPGIRGAERTGAVDPDFLAGVSAWAVSYETTPPVGR